MANRIRTIKEQTKRIIILELVLIICFLTLFKMQLQTLKSKSSKEFNVKTKEIKINKSYAIK